jgi:hypothetical protein
MISELDSESRIPDSGIENPRFGIRKRGMAVHDSKSGTRAPEATDGSSELAIWNPEATDGGPELAIRNLELGPRKRMMGVQKGGLGIRNLESGSD